MSTFAAFLLAATLLAITPGPGIAYVVARTAAGGRAEGLASCAGTALGGLVHVLAAALGLSVLLMHSAVAFTVVKYVGAAYLVFLGVRLLLRRPVALPTTAEVASLRPGGTQAALRDGAIVEALNVKTALFFLAFLPQFVAADAPVAPQLVLLGAICVTLNTAVDVLAVFGAARLLAGNGDRAARGRWLTRASGVTMIGLGAWLAVAKRQG